MKRAAMNAAATKLQALYRGHVVRVDIQKSKQQHASVVIQTSFRRLQVRHGSHSSLESSPEQVLLI